MKKEMSIILLILSLALPGATGFQTTTGILKIMSSRNSSSSRMPMPARTRTAKYTRTVLFGERAIQAAMEAEARYGPDSPQAQLAWRTANKIKAAFEATQHFGPTSQEARAAWDLVEEVQAASKDVSNGPAQQGGYQLNFNNLLTDEELTAMQMRHQENFERNERMQNLDRNLNNEEFWNPN